MKPLPEHSFSLEAFVKRVLMIADKMGSQAALKYIDHIRSNWILSDLEVDFLKDLVREVR